MLVLGAAELEKASLVSIQPHVDGTGDLMSDNACSTAISAYALGVDYAILPLG